MRSREASTWPSVHTATPPSTEGYACSQQFLPMLACCCLQGPLKGTTSCRNPQLDTGYAECLVSSNRHICWDCHEVLCITTVKPNCAHLQSGRLRAQGCLPAVYQCGWRQNSDSSRLATSKEFHWAEPVDAMTVWCFLIRCCAMLCSFWLVNFNCNAAEHALYVELQQ